MIFIEKTEVFGWNAAIRGMRNPKNSWDRSDSTHAVGLGPNGMEHKYILGPNDLKLAKTLAFSSPDDGKFLRMIHVQADITAPIYWWKEYDTYKVGTVADSCSTMHKIQSKPLTLDDISTEHLYIDEREYMQETLDVINEDMRSFNTQHNKEDWWQIIQMLPMSFNQKRTVDLNYAVLRNMYRARKNHKLDEWHNFCAWVESLPYSELITTPAYNPEAEALKKELAAVKTKLAKYEAEEDDVK